MKTVPSSRNESAAIESYATNEARRGETEILSIHSKLEEADAEKSAYRRASHLDGGPRRLVLECFNPRIVAAGEKISPRNHTIVFFGAQRVVFAILREVDWSQAQPKGEKLVNVCEKTSHERPTLTSRMECSYITAW